MMEVDQMTLFFKTKINIPQSTGYAEENRSTTNGLVSDNSIDSKN